MIQLNIKIHMNSEVTSSFIKGLDFDVAVMATGSAPYYPNIPRIQNPLVTNCCEVLSGKKEVGSRVIILGGGLEGCETAAWLAQKGRSVTVVEMLDRVATNIHRANREMLLDMMEELNIEILTESNVVEVLDDGVILVDKVLNRKYLKCDNLILGIGLKPVRDLCETLRNESIMFYEAGDCKNPRNLHYAILEGFDLGYSL